MSVVIYKLTVIVLLLVILQNNTKIHGTCVKINEARSVTNLTATCSTRTTTNCKTVAVWTCLKRYER